MLSTLNPEQLSTRLRMGCDVPCSEKEPQYAITCPRCDGELNINGRPCPVCAGSRYPGRKIMTRCPRSHMTPQISAAMDANAWTKRGIMPAAGSYGDQSPTFLQFSRTFEGEIAATQREEQEIQRLKAQRSKSRKRKR